MSAMNEKFLSIDKILLTVNETTVNALLFRPPQTKLKNTGYAIFTHGYTSHKISIFSWAQKLCDDGVPTLIFDQPGHFTGSFHDVNSFEDFKNDAPELFKEAITKLTQAYPNQEKKLLVGGHSLGALTSILAVQNNYFEGFDIHHVGVGFGVPPEGVTHVFDTPFYQATVRARAELVSTHLGPDTIFPWIKDQKHNLTLSGHKVHLISGEDDVVVGKEGMENFAKILEELGNTVTMEKPKKLGHHLPDMAGSFIKKYAKKIDLI